MGTKMTAPAAAAAMATRIIEPEKRSSMIVSFRECVTGTDTVQRPQKSHRDIRRWRRRVDSEPAGALFKQARA
jgi:hypothetical protein